MSVVTTTILSSGTKIDPAYEVVSLDVTKEVNRIPCAQIVLIDGDAAKQKFVISDTKVFEPGAEIEIKLRYEGEPGKEATVFKGVVICHRVEAGQQGSLLTVELKDKAIKLAHARKSAVYREKTDSDVIGGIIEAGGLKKGTVAATKTTHKELVQYYCTDWDFVLSRAEANGLLVVVNDGEMSLPEMAITGSPKHTFEYGISEIYNFEMEADAGHQYGSIQSIAWDMKEQKLTSAAKAKEFTLSQGNLKAKAIAQAVGADTALLTSPIPLVETELQAWSDATMARSRMAMIKGRVAVQGMTNMMLMDVIEIKGVGQRFNGKTVVTGFRHRVDQHGWQTDVQFGLSADRFVEQPDIVDVPAAGLVPAVNGLQIGVVVGNMEDPDGEFRVKIKLPGLDESQDVWARLASPDAGKERGYFSRPEPGDEVVVGFFNDDPRHGVILGAMYGSKNTLPKDVKVTEDNFLKAIVTKKGTMIQFDDEKALVFIQTPAKNKILLDDDAKAVKLSDQHGNTITMDDKGITVKSAKDFKVDASGNVEIKGTKVDVK